MLVLPAELTHEHAAACSRMLAQGLRSQPESSVVADAGSLAKFEEEEAEKFATYI